MAVMIPSMLNRDIVSTGEAALFDLLAELPENYYVFHSVPWQEQRYGTKQHVIHGETDFLVLVPDRGLICFEVKDGDIRFTRDRGWVQINRRTGAENDIDPFEQANRSKYFFLRVLKKEFDNKVPLMVCAAVWFTSIKGRDIPNALPHECSKEIILSSEDMSNAISAEKAIHRVLSYYGAQSSTAAKAYIDRVLSALMPEFQVFSSPKNLLDQTKRLFHRMTREQSTLLDYLDEQQTATIQGIAGTGKTILAVEKAKRLSQDGDVLFLCFNAYLKEHLDKSFAQPGITFTNLDTLLVRITRKFLPLDYSSEEKDEEILDMLLSWEDYNLPYKHFVIDEGQDFADMHLVAINEIAKHKKGCFYVFYDSYQFVQGSEFPEWLKNAECRLVLNRNCRNTREIALTSSKPVNIDQRKLRFLNQSYTLPFCEKPGIAFVKNATETKESLAKAIQNKRTQGVALDQIVVLTVGSIENSGLKSSELRLSPNITLSLKPEKGKVLFTTVRKFKGLEADAVILIDVDGNTFKNEIQRKAFYVGASRAKIWLDILLKVENDEDLIDISTSMTGEVYNAQRSRINIVNWLQVVIRQ